MVVSPFKLKFSGIHRKEQNKKGKKNLPLIKINLPVERPGLCFFEPAD